MDAEVLLGNQVPETIALARAARDAGRVRRLLASAPASAAASGPWSDGDAEAFARRWDAGAFVARPGPPVTSLL